MDIRVAFKKYFAGPFLVLFILIVFSLLVNFPVPYVYLTLNTGFLIFLSLFFFYETMLVINSRQVSVFYLLMLLFSIVPIIGATQAYINYGQPIIYGLLAERTKVLAFGGLFIIYLLEKNLISLKILESVVLKSAVAVFSILLFLYFFIPTAVLEDYDFVISSVSKGFRIKLNHNLIVILYFYVLIAGVERKNRLYILLVVLILIYFIFLFKARSLTLSLLFASFLFALRQIKIFKFLSWGIIYSVIGIVGFSIGYFLFQEQFKLIFELFASAFNVFIGGVVTDSSALSRISQFEIAKNGLLEHPIFGNGFLSNQWQGGLRGWYGYFYPSDIGWMGTLYLYGIVGTLIFCVPFALTWRYSIKLSKKGLLKGQFFIRSLVYTMLYLFVHSFTAGFFVKKLGMVVFIFSLIYYYYYQSKDKPVKDAF